MPSSSCTVALCRRVRDDLGMTETILLTGFGPFPGAPYNPTGPLVMALARRRHPAFANVRRVAHIFQVSYEAVDRELPALLERETPAALIMFGLATRATQVRVEMRARNAITRMVPDVSGRIPLAATIRPGAPPTVPAAHAGAAAVVCSTRDRCAGRTVARRRPLSLQLLVLAGRRGRWRRRASPGRIRACPGRAAPRTAARAGHR